MEFLENLLQKYDAIVYRQMKDYSQFTIDFIENNLQDLEYSESNESTLIESLIYQINNILDIIVDGKDKDLFIDLKNNLDGYNRD